jgi:hypothetical protein
VAETCAHTIHVKKRKSGQKTMRRDEPKPEPPRARVPRVSKLMALAIRFDHLIRDGVVEDQAELAVTVRPLTLVIAAGACDEFV